MADNLLSIKQHMPTKWNSNIMFPSDSDYIVRVCKAEFGESKSSGNPMITVEYEVVAPEVKEIAGDEVTLSGVKTIVYYTTTTFDGQEVDTLKTKNARARLTAFYKLVDPELVIDFENPDTKVLLGKAFYAQMYPEIKEQRKEPTMAQIESAKTKNIRPEGDVMLHPLTRQPLISYWPKIKELFAACPEHNVSAAL